MINFLNLKNTFNMALIDLKKVYKGSVLGWYWLISKPTINIFMYWFLFEIGLRIGKNINDYPYFLWLISGLIPWLYISDIINSLPNSFKKYNYLITKITFPVSVIAKFNVLSRTIVSIILTMIITVIYILFGGTIDIYFIQLPVLLILMYFFMTSLGLILAIIGSISKDLANLVKNLTAPLMFLSPVLWQLDNIKIDWLINIQKVNPIHFMVSSYRKIYIYKKWIFEDYQVMIIFILITTLMFFVSKALYKKTRHEIPDYL